MADGHHCAFVTRFHALQGVTVKEKHTSLFMLLLEHISFCRKPEQLDAILPQIKPRNVLEKIFYLDILIYFKRFSELLQEFKSGDEIAVSKAIKNDWFIKEAFKNLDPVEFVNETLPTMPFNIRMKVLRKIVLDDEEKSDQLFEALVTRYGVFVATVFLPKCSTDKIRETLQKYPIKLSVNQMKAIFDKDSNLILVYIEEYKKNVGDTSFLNHNAILAYIAQQNPEMFFDLLNKYNFDTRLGNRTTKKFVMCKSDEIARKPKKYVKILKNAPLVRKLGVRNKEFFLNFFPRTKENAFPNVENLLKHYPKKIRFNIYRSTFDSIFHDKLCEGDLKYLTEPLFEIMPDAVESERLATIKFNKTGHENLLMFYQPHSAFNNLKEKIDWLKASHQRKEFVTAAVKSCIVHRDAETFSKVLEFILNRLKNDNEVLRDLVESMISSEDEFKKTLNDTHWKSILKIINILGAEESQFINTDLLKLYSIKFSLENNLPVDKSAVIIPNPCQYYNHYTLRDAHILRKALKYKIIRLLEITSERSEDDDENDMLNSVCYIMRECKNYNKQNESDKINIFNYPKAINFVKKVMDLDLLKSNYYRFACMEIENFICIDDPRPELLELQNLYFKRLERYGSGKGLLWFLKYKPDLIKTHFDNVFKQLGDNFYWDLKRKPFWRLWKQYCHLDLDTMMIENILQKGKNEHQKLKTFVFVLSFLMPGPAYLEFAQQYIPQQSKVDIDDLETTKKHCEIQNKVVKCMKNIDLKPEIYLPQVLQFCKGDYLKSALTSLYSCLCRMPETKAREFINAIAKEPALSVNKHATALSCIILDQQTTLGYLENLPVSLSMTILKYFVKNYEDRFWVLFKSKFVQIDETSINMLELSNEIVIPLSHRAEYFEAAWNLIEKFGNKRFKQALIEKIDKNVLNYMNCEIAAKLIDFDEFTVNLLLYNGSDAIVNMIITKLQEFKDKNWSDENKNYLKKRKKISDFVELLFNTYLDMKAKDLIQDNVKPLALVDFRDKFVGVFPPVEAFEEFVKLHVITWRQEEVEVICKKLGDFHNEILQTYGVFACGFLFKTVKRFLSKRFQKEKKLMRLCQCMFNSRKNIDGDLLVVKLLPTSKIECCENIKIYGDILKALRETENDTVKLYLNVHLMSLK